METQLLEQIVEKLKTFPEPALREILNHVDLLEPGKADTEEPKILSEPLLAIAGTLSGLPVKPQQIDIELEDV
ncbi:MAG: hypothetical protein HC852_05780 [Acaryochloridaceae cyanobacterium RU_4_10]|nr:hypothetical protein [Acaryochloridaceae cyanobacterium RU_4_10]